MADLPAEERKKLFIDSLRFVNAIEFEKTNDEFRVIYLLSLEEEIVKRMVYYLQSYGNNGYSIIIENVDKDTVNLKIYEPDTDDFYIKNTITVREGAFNGNKNSYKKESFLSVGQIEIEGTGTKISKVDSVRIPLKSVSFKEFI